jgi:class 3 adenylate cyclase
VLRATGRPIHPPWRRLRAPALGLAVGGSALLTARAAGADAGIAVATVVALGIAGAPAGRPLRRRPRRAEQTFIFCDIVGWTTLTAEQGDARGADVAIGLRRRAGRLLPAHRAHEVKALGDGVMLRCEDPAAALRLGLRLAGQRDVPVRVGIHTGPAIERDGDWYGTTVNIAARLCDAAGSGQVLASEATMRAAGALDGDGRADRRLHHLRNLREPVAAQRVTRAPVPRRA